MNREHLNNELLKKLGSHYESCFFYENKIRPDKKIKKIQVMIT